MVSDITNFHLMTQVNASNTLELNNFLKISIQLTANVNQNRD